jgi:hypothetical protein
MFKHRSGSGADFEVKAVLPYTKLDNKKKVTFGFAHVIIDGKKEAKINVIDVKSAYKDDIDRKILKFIIDYLTDGTTEEIYRDITVSKELEEIQFYTKNGFSIKEENMLHGYKNTRVNLILDKPKYGQFPYKDVEYIPRTEYLMF